MHIAIDGKQIDFELENEKNSYEVLIALSRWLESESMIISNIEIDGKDYYLDDRGQLEKIETREIDSINISTMSLKEYRYSQLLLIQDYFSNLLEMIEIKDMDNTALILAEYPKIKPLLESVIDRVYSSGNRGFIESLPVDRALSDDEIISLKKYSGTIVFVAEERKREIISTEHEISVEKEFFSNFIPEIGTISVLLQTGKDSEALEKIIKFIDFAKKFSRLISYYNMDTGKINPELVNNYNRLLSELGNALEKGDSVLVGDLLEYELSPAIENIFELMAE